MAPGERKESRVFRVRDADEGDLGAFLALGEAMLRESVAPFPPIEPGRVAKQLELTMVNPGVLLAALAEAGTQPIGMVTAVAGDYAFSTERRAMCDLLYVVPDRRGALAAVRLVGHFEKWAYLAGAKTAIMGISTGIHPERTGQLFERLGYSVMGTSYRKALCAPG